jgi:phosphotransferase system enzyme I (PtsI)
MIEVPAAVALADLFARECDFFSIGSNDLIQYTLAVDRANQNVAYLYDPLHPAVLRALAATLQAGQRAGIPVSACGEMAGSLHGAAFLLGLGCTQLSMAPKSVRRIKDLVRRVRIVDLRRMTEEALLQPTGAEVRRVVEAALRPILGAEAAPLMAAPPGKRDGRHEGSA